MTLSITAPVYGNLIDPAWAASITDAVNGAMTGVTGPFSVGGDLSVTGIGRILTVLKTADETVNNSATLQDDDELSLSLPVGTFRIFLDLVWNSGATPDFKYQLSTPAGATGWQSPPAAAGGATYFGALAWTAPGVLDGNGTDLMTKISGTMVVPTAGVLKLRWAQNTANASNTIVRANSLLTAHKIA